MEGERQHLIYLTGFMGSGKSTIAPILANTLGYTHIDIDKEIERRTGKLVKEIFVEMGEPYFRTMEHSVLLKVSTNNSCVVSLGGGTIVNEENLKVIKSTGILIYLKSSPERIFRRLQHKTDRPMLWSDEGTRITDGDLQNRIETLFQQRERFYLQADLIIVTDNRRVGITVDEIVHALKIFAR